MVFFALVRSSETTGGIAAHGRITQSGNAEKEGNATQVFFFSFEKLVLK